MRPGVEDKKNLAGGALFLLLALVGLFYAQDYDTGTASRMGPGYFPTMLCILMVLLSSLLLLRTVWSMLRAGPNAKITGGGEPQSVGLGGLWDREGPIRSVVVILGATLLFALLLMPAGLLVAIAVTVLVSTLAARLSLVSTLALAVGLSLGSIVVFVYGLGVQTPVLGYWFGG